MRIVINFTKSRYTTLRNVILLIVIALIAYWQIAFLQNGLKWDMLDVVFPYRYYIGECLQNGYFPFWNPYQQLGYPIHADLQCPTWYPETLLIGYFFGYSIKPLLKLYEEYLSHRDERNRKLSQMISVL